MTLGALVIIAGFVLVVALAGRQLEHLPITPPMLAVGVGLAISLVGHDEVAVTLGSEEVLLLAEITLIVLLFSDASRISPMSLRDTGSLPLRMLLIGLPLAALLGAVATSLILSDLTWAEAGLVAAILTPTDAAVGQAVVSSPSVPARVRHALEVESGLNDGLIVPVIGVFIVLVEGARLESSAALLGEAVGEIVIGAVVGAVGGYGFAKVSQLAIDREFTAVSSMRLATLSALAATVGLAVSLGGNGFIAAFLAGIALRLAAGVRCDSWLSLPENLGQLGALVAFVVFGATMVEPAIEALSWSMVLVAVVLLTLARMAPVAMALWGSGVQRPTTAFIGWFGPRGLASILFALVLTTESMAAETQELVSIISVVVLASIMLHGATAAPFSKRYGAWLEAHPSTADLSEHHEVPEQRPRPTFTNES